MSRERPVILLSDFKTFQCRDCGLSLSCWDSEAWKRLTKNILKHKALDCPIYKKPWWKFWKKESEAVKAHKAFVKAFRGVEETTTVPKKRLRKRHGKVQ